MKHLGVAGVVLLLVSGPLLAQGFAGMRGGLSGGSTIMLQTPKGLFALRDGVLAKYDPATLKDPQLFQLFGAAPERPAEGADQAAMQKYMGEMQRRLAPPVMLVKENSLLIVIGDGFARVNQDTLQVDAKADLTPPGAPAAGAGGRRAEPAPGYLLVANTLFLMRSTEILSVSVTDGKVIARSTLPKELQPAPAMLPTGGGRGGRGGGGGGNQ